ncbi:helix-turn-helix transcriptional regulator [Natrarchaeobius sp. A-rgal3]|uniref:helix-turn-helix transcriptional regulator n=1 Tax=Natrarchaeobius versutus TaxID=1679078 RepID=UPI00350FE932
MSRSVSVGFVVFVVVVSLVGVPGSAAASGVHDHAASANPTTGDGAVVTSVATASQSEIDSRDFDTTTFEIVVHENGSATWTFRHEQRLDGGEDTSEMVARENFREFAEEFESDGEDFGLYERFQDQAQAMTETGASATDREMEATNFNRTAGIDEQLNPVGIVEMSFLWDGFAATDNGTVVVGDVFQDLYITDDQSIVVVADDELTFESAEPEPEYVGTSLENADSVTWSGEQEFLDGHPRAVLEQSGSETGSAGGGGGPVSGMGDDGADGPPWNLLAIALVVSLAAVIAVVLYRRRSTDTTPEMTAPVDSRSPDDQPIEPTADPTDSFPEEELLSDEDRVVNLIRDNGGRMKQVNIVDETGWSKSKVSMLLSDMEDEGTISKLRVGRENIISLEGFEPEATKSPFDE